MEALRVPVAEADLPSLVERVAAGDQVELTQNGKVVAELRPVDRAAAMAALDRLTALRKSLPSAPVSSVQLLDMIYEERRD